VSFTGFVGFISGDTSQRERREPCRLIQPGGELAGADYGAVHARLRPQKGGGRGALSAYKKAVLTAWKISRIA